MYTARGFTHEASMDQYRSVYDGFANNIGQDVIVDAPHYCNGTSVDALSRIRAAYPIAFPLLFFTTPRLDSEGGVYTFTLPRGALRTGGYVLLEAVKLSHGDEVYHKDYAEAAGLTFIGTIPLSDYEHFFTNEALREMRGREVNGIHSTEIPPVAIVFDQACMIPYDVIHTSDAQEFVTVLLDDVAYVRRTGMSTTPEERQRTASERQRARTMQRMERWVSDNATRHVSLKENEIVVLTNTANEYRDRMVQAHHERVIAMATLEALRKGTKEITDTQRHGLTRLLDKGTISDLDPGIDLLTFTTRMLYAQDERSGAWHEIGQMKVRLTPSTGAMTFQNLTHGTSYGMSGGMTAPHVFSSGNPCVGNFSEMTADMALSGDWLAMIELAIAFIETANTDDSAGRYVHTWPFVHDPASVGLPAYNVPEGESIEPWSFDREEENEDEEEERDEAYVNTIYIEDRNGRHVTDLELAVDEQFRLIIYFADAGGDYDTGIYWSSSDEGIATVDRRGHVEAVAPGVATIWATSDHDNDAAASVEVTVVPVPEVVPA